MKLPGFTAEVVLSQTNNQDPSGLRRRALLDAESGVVPAQIDWASILSSSRGTRRLLTDRPACPLGERAVWVSRGPTEKCCKSRVRVWSPTLMQYIWVPWEGCSRDVCGGWDPGFIGWECQSAFRVAA